MWVRRCSPRSSGSSPLESGTAERALELFERGYADFVLEPFAATDEYSPNGVSRRERAGPFAANLGGFLSALSMA